MPISLEQLINDIDIPNTVLFFGAGSSIPSGAPSADSLASFLAEKADIKRGNFNLSEIASLVEQKLGRDKLISHLRDKLASLSPTGGLMNLPLYDWKSIFTTNYDMLLEVAFEKCRVPFNKYDSNFDFKSKDNRYINLYKLHGTIEKDVSDGSTSRIIISQGDYDRTESYRDYLYDRLKSDLAGATLIIIGYSLNDPHIQNLINRALKISAQIEGSKPIYIFSYDKEEERAFLFEQRGLKVIFGGIDEFFGALSGKKTYTPRTDPSDPLVEAESLRFSTIQISHAVTKSPDVTGMYNGTPATYADIAAGHTFPRTITQSILYGLQEEKKLSHVLLGASGVGKTTALRQVVVRLQASLGWHCWEHKSEQTLNVSDWMAVANRLLQENEKGCIFIDDAHDHLHAINSLLEELSRTENYSLKILLASSRNHWNPRIKSPVIFKQGTRHFLSQLDSSEISNLLTFVENNSKIRALTEHTFSGFSREERRRRLEVRSEKDMFVCLKNIFGTSSLDDIILVEYATIPEIGKDVYKLVAAMASSGVRVHRQLVMRVLGIEGNSVAGILELLADIIFENTIDERQGIYAWRGRHPVIMDIIAKHKYSNLNDVISLFERVIDCISPTYDIEIRTIRELCNFENGIGRIPDRGTQNKLLRRMISVAPGEKIPRHRLIRNLIHLGEFEKAETEIRIFEKDIKSDGPVHRYKIALLVARAKGKGLLAEDRVKILYDATSLAEKGIKRYPNYYSLLATYADVGLEICRITGKFDVFDTAMEYMKRAESIIGDPEISNLIAAYERKSTGQIIELLPTIEAVFEE